MSSADEPPVASDDRPGWLAGFECTPEAVAPAINFRSTWLTSSLLEVRERELFPRYLELLPTQYHEDITGAAQPYAPRAA